MGKRAFADLNSRSEILETLITSLKSNDARANEELLAIIRGGATTTEIAQYALDMSKRDDKSSKRTRSNIMDIVSLTDQPLFRVPAQPWTDVTDDDNAVSHLLSIYLSWQQHCYPVFDYEILIREMNSKQLASRYCSKFLVNAILALACVFHLQRFTNSETNMLCADVYRPSCSICRSWRPDFKGCSLL